MPCIVYDLVSQTSLLVYHLRKLIRSILLHPIIVLVQLLESVQKLPDTLTSLFREPKLTHHTPRESTTT